jgi:hypothetical protein
MFPITHYVARRLEKAEAEDGAAGVQGQLSLDPESGATCESVASGGYLLFTGSGSPLTHALGLGLDGPVTEEAVQRMEEFFHSRDSGITVDVSPYSDGSLLEILTGHGYRISEFSTVLVRPLGPEEQIREVPSLPSTRVAAALEADLYAETVVRGFFGRDEVTAEERNLGRVLFAMPGNLSYFAILDDAVAGCGQMAIHDRVATCFGDSTLVSYRQRGAHAALIRARVREAARHGCDLITAGTQPGSISQRDYERQGFQVAYTKVTMVLD